MRLRVLAVSTALALGTLVPAATPAAANHMEPYCTGVATNTSAGLPLVEVTLCLSDHTGLYDPGEVQCSTITGCWARVTVGHEGMVHVHAELCVEAEGIEPLCSALGTGDVPLVHIPPQSVCFNDSPWGPPCEP